MMKVDVPAVNVPATEEFPSVNNAAPVDPVSVNVAARAWSVPMTVRNVAVTLQLLVPLPHTDVVASSVPADTFKPVVPVTCVSAPRLSVPLALLIVRL